MSRKTAGHRAALVEDVGAEAGQALDAEGEVELQVLLEPVLLRVGQDAVGQRAWSRPASAAAARSGSSPVDADLRRRVRS